MDANILPGTPRGSEGSGEPTLAVSGLSKNYVGVRALANMSLTFTRGEAHAIAGQNGAGKSTLIRMLSGAEQPDSGTIHVLGSPIVIDSPHVAQNAGIVTIYQELSLVPRLSVAENVFMGDLPTNRTAIIDRGRMRRKAGETLKWLGFGIDVDAPVGSLGVAQQ